MKTYDKEETIGRRAYPGAADTPDISIFLPVFDEEPNLRLLHKKLDEALEKLGRTA